MGRDMKEKWKREEEMGKEFTIMPMEESTKECGLMIKFKVLG